MNALDDALDELVCLAACIREKYSPSDRVHDAVLIVTTEIGRLQAIVGTLPKTADGVWITIGMVVFMSGGPAGVRNWRGVVAAIRETDCHVCVTHNEGKDREYTTRERSCPANLYSTEAALKEARKQRDSDAQ